MRRRTARAKPGERLTVGYVRVSSDQQALEGVSLEAQEARLRAYAAAMGWDLAEVIVDAGLSAKTTDRSGMQRVLAGLRDRSVGRVVVVKLDRLTRSVRDLADLIDAFTRAEAALVSLGEHIDSATAAGRLMLNLLGSVSQWEREAIGERTAVALAHKRANGRVYGSTPFGYRREGNALIADEREQHALRIAREMDEAGASFRAIGARLSALGLAPHRGVRWHASSVRAVLRSKIAQKAA